MSGMPDQPPPRSTSWRGRDLRPVAIGAAAGLLVLLIGGIALAASQLGTPTIAQPGPQTDRGPANGKGGPAPIPDRIRDRFPERGFAQRPVFPFGVEAAPRITVTAISGSDVTLQSASGWTRTVSVTDATTIERAGQKIAVADLKVGDAVRIRETRSADGSTTVTDIDVVLPRVLGRVTATASDSLTLQRADGTTMTVHVSASTTYQVRGVTTATLADISVGMIVVAEGPQNADGSLEALSVKAASLP